MKLSEVNHVLSTNIVSSNIFDSLIDRVAAAAPPEVRVTRSYRPRRQADVWHYHRPNLEWRLRPRSVVTIHHDLRDSRGWLNPRYGVPRYREAALIHCLNTRQKSELEEQGLNHIEVIPHGVDRRVFPVPDRPRQFTGERLCLGMISRRYGSGVKGEFLLEALLAELDPRRVRFVFVGAGRGYEARLAASRGFEAACWERLPYRLMGEIYGKIDALLILSLYEGGPACLPEALGSGIPVICTRVGMCVDFVQEGANGVFLTGHAPSDGERIMALLGGGGRGLAELNGGAFSSAPGIPSWEQVMAVWHRLYASVACAAEQ